MGAVWRGGTSGAGLVVSLDRLGACERALTLNASTSLWNLSLASSSLTPTARLSGWSTSASLRYALLTSSEGASGETPRTS